MIETKKDGGAALVIALAFVVLLTGLIVAFFSRAMSERQVSNSSANQTKVEFLAEGAADTIIGDFKQEILAGSVSYLPSPGVSVYRPTAAGNMMPVFSGTAANITTYAPNLLKRSAFGQPFYSGSNYNTAFYPSPNRAANVSSQALSLNGRSISPARWNYGLLLPKANPSSSSDFTPLISGSNAFAAPDWVLVARNGSNPSTATYSGSLAWSATNAATVVGRYAYAVYHEGGLLDMNAAGYPSTTGTAQSAYKNALAYADLSQLTDASGTPLLTSAQIDQIVGWRNYATAQPGGTFPGYTFASGSNYNQFVISNTKGFLAVGNTSLWNGQSDRQFSSRQELINFLTNGIASSGSLANVQNALQYLGTFSRDLNQPSNIAAVQTNASAPVVLSGSLGGNSAWGGDKLINPGFPYVRVTGTFARNDGSTANAGDPLVNKRFALNRLAWVTYKGPSALRTQSDADIQALINNGIPWSYLQLGTATNIQKYFGLAWDAANNRWKYNIHNGANTGKGIIMLVGRPIGTPADATTYVQDSSREPDFFELLKAGITVGSLGKAAASSGTSVSSGAVPTGYLAAQNPVNVRYNLDSSVDYHIIQIGANILSEVNPTSYPARITFDDGSARGAWEFQGVTDLPYLSYVFNGVLRTQAPVPAPPGSWADFSPFQYPNPVNGPLTTPGNAYMIQVPAVWNPYDPNGPAGVVRPSQFRVVIDSNDPLNLSGSSNPIWRGAEATPRTGTNAYGGINQGLGLSDGVYSWTVNGPGKTTENPTQLPTYPLGNGTPITDAVTFTDGAGALYREPTLIFSTTAPGNATRSGTLGNITSIDSNPLPGEGDGSNGPWAPLVLGQFPLAFSNVSVSGTTTYFTGTGLIGLAAGNGDNRVYFTYRLQYQDPNNASNWITYDTKYGRTTHGLFSFQVKNNPSPCVTVGPNGFNPYSWASAMDPRSARFGLIMETLNPQRSGAWSAGDPPATGWIYDSGGITTAVGINYPIRQNNSHGFYFVSLDGNNVPPGAQNNDKSAGLLTMNINNLDVPYPFFSAGWTSPLMPINEGHGESDVWMCAPGMYAQNNPSAPFYEGSAVQPSYYADADGVVRRAAGAYVPSASGTSATTPVGLPPASIQGYTGAPSTLITPASKTPFTQSQSRPLLLHRPFRTVAELGYVFRDLPWKNLDFFTPESGDAALLDLFCINETSDSNGMVAGKVNLNTRQAPVLSAIVSGACVDDPKVTDATVGSISPTLSGSIGSLLVARTSGTMVGPLQNISELVGKWNGAIAATSGTSYAPVVATANCGIDLPLNSGTDGYKDGQLSYTGFSGATSVASGTTGTLADAYAGVSNASLKASISQVQRFREAPIRALTSAGQTRVWNLMIDVIAQTGRYPQSVNSLDKFQVESEQRYWVHVAIDRLTGQVIDKQIEVVKE